MPTEAKTVAKSFRINKDALEAFEQEARKQAISLNTLVNQCLLGYSELGRYMKQMHSLTITRQSFTELLNLLPEDKLIETGRKAGKNTPMAIVTSKHGKMNFNGLIEYLHYLSSYANLFEYSETEENGQWTITLTHELGRKWSLFLAGYFEQAFTLIGVKTQRTVSDASVTLTCNTAGAL